MLESTGASFFDPLHQAAGGGYPGETIDALWSLVWRGLITNDSLHALRAYIARPGQRAHAAAASNRRGRSARAAPRRPRRRAAGRCCWPVCENCLRLKPKSRQLAARLKPCPYRTPTATERSHALAMQLLNRYGVLLRESAAAENVPGGFSAVYDVLKALEESGRIRRGYFVAGLGATQFALPAAVDLLRQLRTEPPLEKPEFVQLAAADPANPYGSVLRWPDLPVAGRRFWNRRRACSRARPMLKSFCATASWWRGCKRGNPNLLVFLPAEEPERSQVAAGLAHFLCARGQERMHADSHEGVLITTINGQPVAAHFMARFLMDAGFHPGPLGMHLRRIPLPVAHARRRAGRGAVEMPEGDTIFRTARALGRALGGKPVTGFRSTLSAADALQRRHAARRPDGRSRGGARQVAADPFFRRRHSGLALLMSGSWHIYRHGERWQLARIHMRIVIENSEYQAVGFRVPVAEMHTARSLARDRAIPAPENDSCSAEFDAAAALERLMSRGRTKPSPTCCSISACWPA